MTSRLIGCLLVAFALTGCGSGTATNAPPSAVQRDVAGRFATALLRGDAAGATALLARTEDTALAVHVRRAAAPWRTQHASIRLPARRTGDRWTFSYTGRRTRSDRTFETETGDLAVVVAAAAEGAAVRFFAFTHVHTRFSTHHDSQLLPSNR